jgi:LacI family transcriptional regulator
MPERSKPVTMAEVAEKVGVSKNTVSLALRGDRRISAKTRESVEKIARDLGYRKNPVVAHLMSELRKEKPPEYHRTLALFNAHPNPRAFTEHPTIVAWVEGCRRRAQSQGYLFDEFWLHDPDLNGVRMVRILNSRGIEGGIVVGHFSRNRLPERFAPLWEKIACVVAGVRTHEPTLSFCCVDHHALMLEAMRQVLALKYKRPALVLNHVVDELVEGRFTAGMWVGQQALPARQRVPAFDKEDESDACFRRFGAWFEKHRPDVVLTLHREVKRWLERLGKRIPKDVGIVDLEHNPAFAHWAAMEQRNDLSGEAAVDLLITMLHNNESGVQALPRATLGSSHWVPGVTVRKQR